MQTQAHSFAVQSMSVIEAEGLEEFADVLFRYSNTLILHLDLQHLLCWILVDQVDQGLMFNCEVVHFLNELRPDDDQLASCTELDGIRE